MAANKKTTSLQKSKVGEKNNFLFSWSLQPNVLRDVTSQIRFLSLVTSLIVFGIGLIVLLGWILHLPTLTRISPFLPSMKTNTAIGFLFASVSLFLANYIHAYKMIKWVKDIFALAAYLIGALTVFQYVFSVNLGIDQLLFAESTSSSLAHPNRMALNTALLLTSSGIALFLLDRRILGKYYSQFFALVNSIILTPTVISYLYNINFLYGLGANSKISLHAAFGFIFLTIGIIFARPTQGFMSLIVSNSTGGFLARRLLLTSIISPFILSWIILTGYKGGLYDDEFRFLLLTLSCMILFTYLIWRTAQSLYRIDIQKRETEGNLQFLSQAGKILVSSINYKKTLRIVANLAVSYMGEYCAVDMIDENGKPQQIILAGRDRKKEKMVNDIRKKHLRTMYTARNYSHVLKTKNSVLIPHITEEMLRTSVPTKDDWQKLKKLGISSIMLVPILSHTKLLGIIQFISLDKIYTPSDVATAEELASRASLAIENARLFNDVNHALKLRDEFISIASHELKTPITTLKVYSQILEKRLEKNKENANYSQYLQKMRSQIDRLTTLIQDLLDVTKVKAGKLSFIITSFDMNILVKEIVEDLQTITPTHKIHIEGAIHKMIEGDKERVGQVLINLLTNAIKYSPNSPEVRIILSENEKNCMVAVRDYGIGIDANHVAKIFDRFYQVKEGKKVFAGLGMGLYIAKEIALRHKGDLLVESKKGKGSTFTLVLPTM